MRKKNFKYIYGPVSSWRLGVSLGVDLVSQQEKICTFNCTYCQLGNAGVLTTKRRLFVPTAKVVREIIMLPKVNIDYITFSGRGEPTLAVNLGATIKALKRLRKEPIAVLTNASLLSRKDVRKQLLGADLVALKLDADSERLLKLVNRPQSKVKLSNILKGAKQFRKEYHGKLALQIMFTQENKAVAQNIAKLAKGIHADEIQINTPTRTCSVKPLTRKTILQIKRYFRGMRVITVYDSRKKKKSKAQALSIKGVMFRRAKDV